MGWAYAQPIHSIRWRLPGHYQAGLRNDPLPRSFHNHKWYRRLLLMSDTAQWDQSHFDATLKEYLLAHESKVWPQLVNKKAFYVALGAYQQCQRLQPARLRAELDRPVMATRADGTSGTATIGNIL